MFNLTRVMKKTILTGAMLMASTSLWAAEHWIDVRTPDQFQDTHVEGAVNIPLADLKTRIAAEVPDKNDTIHVYCNVGRQSGQAQQMLRPHARAPAQPQAQQRRRQPHATNARGQGGQNDCS